MFGTWLSRNCNRLERQFTVMPQTIAPNCGNLKRGQPKVASWIQERGIYAASSAKALRGMKQAEVHAPGARIASIRSTQVTAL
jgi:hypothetical protein